jgi:Lon protease-like protein
MDAASTQSDLPIFPLGAVLFPDGVLPLRIFEARYMDMIRECLKNETSFGVCLITTGSETGEPAKHEAMGCSATISEWDMEQLGLLKIRTIGQQRFEIQDRQIETDGLITAQVQYLEAEPDTQVPEEFEPCVQILKRIVDDLVAKESDEMQRMIQPPYRFDSASWVSMRLSEFLPIDIAAKHQMMVMNDPVARLLMIREYLREQQVL